MQFNSISAYLPSLESTIDPHITLVTPETPLVEVVAMMSQTSYSHCDLTSELKTSDSDSLAVEPSSAVLIVKNNQLIGIFTERDLVKLTALQTQWQNYTISQVMTHPVISLTKTPAQSLLVALSVLRQYCIRHLPVISEQGEILGIINSSSIRKALQPLNLLKWKTVGEVMTHNVISVPACTKVLQITQLMLEHKVSCVVLTQPQKQPDAQPLYPIGVITERDIVQYQTLEIDLSQLSADKVMSTPLFKIRTSDSLIKAQQLMQQHRLRRLIVTGAQGEIQGIITQSNLLRVFDPLEIYEFLEFLHQKVEQSTLELKESNQKLRIKILEREMTESRLKEALRKEKELNQLKTHITAMVSHDLRTPLSNILMTAQLLQDTNFNLSQDKQIRYLERIEQSVKQMTELLNDILTISEVEAETVELYPSHVELVSFCQELVESVELATQSKCRIQFQTQMSNFVTEVDDKLLRQILVNLLSNAVKYSPAGTEVNFCLYTLNKQIAFEIQDQGIGIPEADQPHLFTPFYRASNVRKFEGTGLGLAIVKRSVEAYQGSIELKSEEGEGSTFTVTLPLKEMYIKQAV